MTSPTDDEARWAQAQSILDGGPTTGVERRLRRYRIRVLLILGLVVALALVVLLLLPDGDTSDDSARPPEAQRIVGLVVMGVALVLQGIGLVLLWRANRGRPISPLFALTAPQRRELLAQVRLRAPVDPRRLPVARHVAETMLDRPPVMVMFLGAGVLWGGLLILHPSWWRLTILIAFVVLAAWAWWTVRRNDRDARRFLAAHPAPDAAAG